MTDCARCKTLEAQLVEAERLWRADRDALTKATSAAALEWKRTGEAHADAALAWRRVTELQESNTALVQARRAAEAKLAEACRVARIMADGINAKEPCNYGDSCQMRVCVAVKAALEYPEVDA